MTLTVQSEGVKYFSMTFVVPVNLPSLSLYETGSPAYTLTRFGTVYGLRN